MSEFRSQRHIDSDGDAGTSFRWSTEEETNDPGSGTHSPGEDSTAKSSYYDYSAEKSMSQVEAKMFYHRHRMASEKGEEEIYSPISRSQTFSAYEPSTSLSRSGSLLSNRQESKRGKGRSTTLGSNYAPHLPKDTLVEIPEHSSLLEISDEDGEDEDAEDGIPVPANLADIIPELRTICTNIKRALAIRRKYIKLSLQTWAENPKNDPGWEIYPSPPVPVWNEEKNRARPDISGSTGSLGSAGRRKAGHNIGQDFELSEVLPVPGKDDSVTFHLNHESVFQVVRSQRNEVSGKPIVDVPTLRDYYIDLGKLTDWSADGPSKTFAFKELEILEGKFNLYAMENAYQEMADAKIVPHRDFYNVRKVDTHVHHSSCMNQKHLLRYIKSKMKKAPQEEVMERDGQLMSLEDVFKSIKLDAYDLSIDTLDMHAHTDSFHRFDKFNLKYNPIGESRLRTIFLKTDNHIQGKYLAEITREVISDLESSKYQMVEWRISIYGKSPDEWAKLADWVVDNRLFSHNVRWLIQIPRLYEPFKKAGNIQNFEEIVINIFRPLFEVTENPSSNPKLHIFLQRVIGFDTVDDESKPERRVFRKFPTAREWDTKQNPPYTHWIYYLFANMTSLNAWRKQRGFNTFLLRPHCGEAGDPDHLACAVLCCHSISHGITLRKVPFFQYLFYLDQIGIAMSPLSNNALFLSYERNPFIKYFRRGLNVSLSTDDPLQLAFTKEPLIEEYSVAAQIYKLSAADMCELAANSVLQSGFEHSLKQHWLGRDYAVEGPQANEVKKTNVPDLRRIFRYDTLRRERAIINRYAEPPEDELLNRGASSTMLAGNLDEDTKGQRIDGDDGGKREKREMDGGVIDGERSPTTKIKSTSSSFNKPRRSSTTATTNMTSSSSPFTLDNAFDLGPMPKIFPGLVQERTRRSSMKQKTGFSAQTADGEGVAGSREKVVTREDSKVEVFKGRQEGEGVIREDGGT